MLFDPIVRTRAIKNTNDEKPESEMLVMNRKLLYDSDDDYELTSFQSKRWRDLKLWKSASWQAHLVETFPTLQYLCTLATSMLCEWLYSTTGRVMVKSCLYCTGRCVNYPFSNGLFIGNSSRNILVNICCSRFLYLSFHSFVLYIMSFGSKFLIYGDKMWCKWE